MRPPFFLFGACPKRKNVPRPVEERKRRLPERETQGRSAGRRRPNVGMPGTRGCPLPLWSTDRSAQKHHTAARRSTVTLAGSASPTIRTYCPASRGSKRASFPVRSTGERQRYAGVSSTCSCFSGDSGSSLGFPFSARGQGDTSPCPLSLKARKPFFPREERKVS